SITQFVESYILEPYIVGHKVDMNPVMTIIAVVFGEFIWGVPGMVLAIPVLGIVKVICDRIEVLQPVGYAIGEEGIEGGDNIFTKFGKWVKSKFHKNE
ncbi:MAG: AI-2E family transporter, partial [Candidatus Cyclobacteriaceae bacterium M2_1C_046]